MKPPAFQFYADDFTAGTSILSTEEVGAYILLLCHQWNCGGVPNDDKLIHRIAKTTQAFDLALVKAKFELVDGLLKNSRMERERDKQIAFREKQAINGSFGGRPRNPSLSQAKPKPNPTANPNESSPSPTPTPIVLPPSAGKHGAFIEGWVSGFKLAFGVDYKFEAGRDGKAVKELLTIGVEGSDLLDIAKKAWQLQSFNGRQSHTIHGFKQYFNNINVEIKNGNNSKPNSQRIDRSIGTANEGKAMLYKGLGRLVPDGDTLRPGA